jgi:hypothetical protein
MTIYPSKLNSRIHHSYQMTNPKFLKQKTNQSQSKIIRAALLAVLLVFAPYSLNFNSYYSVFLNYNNANANMLNKFKDGFYFEKYSTADEAKEALLELHPIGSDVGDLVKTLEGANGKFINSINRKDLLSNPVREKEYFSEDVSKTASVKYRYEYDTGIWLINPITWFVSIYCDSNNNITNLHLSRSYMGL